MPTSKLRYKQVKPKPPIINCHTHIFTSRYVPGWLARSFLPLPLYFLAGTRFWVWAIKVSLSLKWKWTVHVRHASWRFFNGGRLGRMTNFLNGQGKFIATIIILFLSVNSIFILINWISEFSKPDDKTLHRITAAKTYTQWMLIPFNQTWIKATFVLFSFGFFKSARKVILYVLDKIWKFLKVFPSKKWKLLMDRYLLLGRYAFYKRQQDVFYRLQWQYPPKTKFIVLPMDMQFMGAGKLTKKGSYYLQLQELAKIKLQPKGAFMAPFVFVDPRRVKSPEIAQYIKTKLPSDQSHATNHLQAVLQEKANAKSKFSKRRVKRRLESAQFHVNRLAAIKPLFDYDFDPQRNNRVILKPGTVIKEYIEDKGFSGFKIYPALGYYPFDESLLPIWKYAAERQIPIMTHCVRGTIFFRGHKKFEWNTHPVFQRKTGGQLELRQKKNDVFTGNFTHPLNYLCLVHEPLLRVVVGQAKDPKIRSLFGYKGPGQALTHNLSKLKICLAHFGGEEEWVRYLEGDRNYYSDDLIQDRSHGLNLNLYDKNGQTRWSSLEQIWYLADWYSIICSLINQYPNIYTDVSYILSKPRIYPLLQETLNKDLNPKLYRRVLFGTDFYMVRNHNSDKDLLASISGGLSEQQFDQIARRNPLTFL